MRIRLKTRCFINGHLHDPGDIVDLPEGTLGPYRGRHAGHQQLDDKAEPNVLDDEPLYDVVEDGPAPATADQEPPKEEAPKSNPS